MAMLRHILVAYADDDSGEEALATASDLARASGARVTIAHVVPVVDDDPVDVRTQVAVELLAASEDARRRRRLVTLAATALADVDTDVRVLTGGAVEQLLALAHAEHPDLIIAGASRAAPILPFLRRGVAERLIDRAPCPVLVVHGRRGARPQPMVDAGASDGEAMTSSHLLTDAAPPAIPAGPRPSRARSLLWQLFFADAVMLLTALIVLVVSPVRVSPEVVLGEVVVLTAGLAVLLVVHLLLLRKTLAPLRLLTGVIGTIDPRRPGRRLPVRQAGSAEVVALAEAFNTMLDRLEDERRDSSRRALAARRTSVFGSPARCTTRSVRR